MDPSEAISANDIHEEPTNPQGLPPSEANTDNNINNNINISQAINIRDRLFFALFFRVTVAYARIVPRWMRMVIEFYCLLQAVLSFFVLIYVHMNYARNPANCLEPIKDVWSREGILRVEIIRLNQHTHAEQTGTDLFTVEHSYKNEFKLGQLEENKKLFSPILNPFSKSNNAGKNEGLMNKKFIEKNYQEAEEVYSITSNVNLVQNHFSNHVNVKDGDKYVSKNTTINKLNSELKGKYSYTRDSTETHCSKYANSSVGNFSVNSLKPSTNNLSPTTDKNKGKFYRNYIVEYSLEYGFLRLSPSARTRLGIPVMLVALEPSCHKCFGDSVGRFFLEYLLGYDEILISSIKTLVKNDKKKGFIRNFVTGEHYRFESIWMAGSSYIASFVMMIVFTLSISMLLRYSHHQIFVLAGESLNLFDLNGTLTFPAAPLLSVILGLVGIEALMSEVLYHTTTAFCIILIVWFAEQYDKLCSYCEITKKYWLRFFYLYHFSFYAYHFRFNGQYSKLAMISSWLFIQHSMVYFYHHYELPSILQQNESDDIVQGQLDPHANDGGFGGDDRRGVDIGGLTHYSVYLRVNIINGLRRLGRLRVTVTQQFIVRPFYDLPLPLISDDIVPDVADDMIDVGGIQQ